LHDSQSFQIAQCEDNIILDFQWFDITV